MAQYNKKLSGMENDIADELWYAFHGGDINNSEDFYEYIHEWIDNQVIYTYDCEKILKQNMEYCFDEHDIYGRPENIHQAAYACLYDYIIESDVFDIWEDMEATLAGVEIRDKNNKETV